MIKTPVQRHQTVNRVVRQLDMLHWTEAPGDFQRLPVDDAHQDQVQAAAGLSGALDLTMRDCPSPWTLVRGQ